MSVPTSRESDKFMLRLPEGMRDRIKAAADENGRSMNAEIVAALEEKFPGTNVLLDQQKALQDRISSIDSFMRTPRATKLPLEAKEEMLREIASLKAVLKVVQKEISGSVGLRPNQD